MYIIHENRKNIQSFKIYYNVRHKASVWTHSCLCKLYDKGVRIKYYKKIDYLVLYIHSNNTQFYLNFNQVIQIPVIIQVTNICIFKDLSIFLLISLYIIALKNCNIIFWIITLLKKIFLRDSCKSLVLLIITCILYIYK